MGKARLHGSLDPPPPKQAPRDEGLQEGRYFLCPKGRPPPHFLSTCSFVLAQKCFSRGPDGFSGSLSSPLLNQVLGVTASLYT